MITVFRVEGFKSLQKVAIDLGRINIFIGANGSGKSNLLESIGVMGSAAFGSVEPETLRYRGVRPGLPALYKTSFQGQHFRRLISLEAGSNDATYRLGLDNPIRNPSVRWRIASESLEDHGKPVLSRSPRGCRFYDATGRSERITPRQDQTLARLALALTDQEDVTAAQQLMEELTGYAIYSPTTPVLRGIATEEVSRDPLGLTGGGLPEAVQHITRRAEGTIGPFDRDEVWELIEWAEDMAAVPAPQALVSPAVKTAPVVLRFKDRFMRWERSVLSAYDASEGALYVLFLIALSSHERSPPIFAVDNFDHAIHPRLAAALTSMVSQQIVKEGKRQLLATTHNPLVLDGLDLTNDQIRLFAVDRDPAGVTQVSRVQVSEELLAESRKGLPLSRLWLMGRLGGIPRSL
ncbi:MAG: AAA family ATPase [Thermodesulfobacteriota bacterium]